MSFRNSILAGLTLIREAIRSQNYQAGVQGWAINADGTAEFSDLTIRSSDGSGNTVELANGEIILFKGGTAVAALSAVIPGLVVGQMGAPQIIVYSDSGTGRMEFDANSPAAGIHSALTMAVFNPGDPDENISLQLQGPGVVGATDRVELLLSSQNTDGSSQANIVGRVAGGPSLLVWDRTGSATFVRWVISPPAGNLSPFWVNAASGHTGVLALVSKGGVNHLVVANGGHLQVLPNGSNAVSCIYVNTDLGQTAPLLRLQRDSNDAFVVDSAGRLSTYAGNDVTSWTPSITGGGAATLSTADGWYQRLGKLIYVYGYFVIGVAGSGATNVQINLPVTPWRGSANRRQVWHGAVRDGGYASPGPVAGLIFAGGAGATINRLVDSAGNDVTGAMLTAGSIWTFEGWLREA
jgi:hypothetical protein